MISALELQGGKENEYHTAGKQYSCYTDLQNKHDGTVWVPILTAPLAPLLTGHLRGSLYIKCYDYFQQTIYTRDS